jgi:hypothetical protein
VKLNINGNAATILKTPKKRSSGEEVIVLSPSIPESFDDQKKAKVETYDFYLASLAFSTLSFTFPEPSLTQHNSLGVCTSFGTASEAKVSFQQEYNQPPA